MKKFKITVENLHEQTLSDIFLNVLDDIDIVLSHGIKIDMDTYWDVSELNSESIHDHSINEQEINRRIRKPVCVGCLGGIAVMGMLIPPIPTVKEIRDFCDINPSLIHMRNMFDAFRSDNKIKLLDMASRMLGKEEEGWENNLLTYIKFYNLRIYDGAITGAQLEELKQDIINFATFLKLGGY
jgi:hypothetical protein